MTTSFFVLILAVATSFFSMACFLRDSDQNYVADNALIPHQEARWFEKIPSSREGYLLEGSITVHGEGR